MNNKNFISSFLDPLFEICDNDEYLINSYLQLYRKYIFEEFFLPIKELGFVINRKERNCISRKKSLIEKELLIELSGNSKTTFQLRHPKEALEILKQNTNKIYRTIRITKNEKIA